MAVDTGFKCAVCKRNTRYTAVVDHRALHLCKGGHSAAEVAKVAKK